MGTTLLMANHYNVKPSELIGLENEYTAYCFDEIGLMLWNEAIQEDGSIDFSKIYSKKENTPSKSNQGLAELMKGGR